MFLCVCFAFRADLCCVVCCCFLFVELCLFFVVVVLRFLFLVDRLYLVCMFGLVGYCVVVVFCCCSCCYALCCLLLSVWFNVALFCY